MEKAILRRSWTIAEAAVFDRHPQHGKGLLQHPPGLVVGGREGFAAAAPQLGASLAADHTCQQLALIGAEHLPDLEAPEARLGGLQIAAGGLEQLPLQVVAQVAVIGQERVGKGYPSRRLRHQGEGAGLLQAGAAEGTAQESFRLLGGFESAGQQGIGQMGGEVVVAHQPRHLLDQIHRSLQIHGPRRWHGNQPAVIACLKGAAECFEGGHDAAVGQILGHPIDQHRPEQVMKRVALQPQGLGGNRRSLVKPAAFHPRTGKLLKQLHRPVGGSQGRLTRQSLLETAARFGAQAGAAGGKAHRLRGEHGSLQPQAGGLLADGLLQATHDAGQGDRPIGAGDQQRLRCQGAIYPVEGGQALSRTSLAHPQGRGLDGAARQTCQGIAIKGMQGLPRFQHHQIGDVHHVVDRAHATALQPLPQPQRRSPDLHPAELGDAEQSACLDRRCSGAVGLQWLGFGSHGSGFEAGAAPTEGSHLTGDALHRETIGAVGGDRQLQHLVVETERRTHGLTQGWHGIEQLIEHGDAFGAFGQAQLLERTDHAVAGDAAQLRGPDRELHGGQSAAHQGHGHMNAGADVGGTADDLQHFARSRVDAADAEAVGVGVGLPRLYKTHHHACGAGCQIIDLLNLKSGDRKTFRQPLRLE
jgi:hypothetical protein